MPLGGRAGLLWLEMVPDEPAGDVSEEPAAAADSAAFSCCDVLEGIVFCSDAGAAEAGGYELRNQLFESNVCTSGV